MPVIIIPAFQPDQTLITLVKELGTDGYSIIIVNDGSYSAHMPIFKALDTYDFVKVLHHAVNLGKGQALKTAFNYFLIHSPDPTGVITADADGQHDVKDIHALSQQFSQAPHAVWLGVRSFNKNTPWRSRIGNHLTRFVFHLLIGHHLKDTQTGLRALPRTFLKSLLKIPSCAYEFELDMLILASQKKIQICEFPIQTIYKDNNAHSHFNPLIDSLKIYFVFLRFSFFSVLSGLLDFLAFSLGFLMLNHILLSETLARFFSGTCNFFFNKALVFKSSQKILPEAIKYALLCIVNLIFSYTFISCFIFLGMNIYASKLIALLGLFIANFAIQNRMIFKDGRNKVPNHFLARKSAHPGRKR